MAVIQGTDVSDRPDKPAERQGTSQPSQREIEAKKGGGSPAPSKPTGPRPTENTTQTFSRTAFTENEVNIASARRARREKRTRVLVEGIEQALATELETKPQETVLTEKQKRQLSERADKLTPGLLRANPGLAADLLFSSTPTRDLREVSEVTYESDRAFELDVRKRMEKSVWGDSISDPSQPDAVPEEQRVRDADIVRTVEGSLTADLKPYAQYAMDIEDPEQRQLFWAHLLWLSKQPAEIDGANRVTIAVFSLKQAKEGVLDSEQGSAQVNNWLIEASTATGHLVGGPMWWALKGGSTVGGKVLRGVGAEGIAESIGSGARTVEGGVGYGIRVAQGLAVSGVAGAVGGFGENDRINYIPTWDDFSDGGPGPVSAAFFDVSGLNPREYEGLSAVLDMSADLFTADAVLRAGAHVRAGRTQPHVRFDGTEFVDGIGRGLVKDVQKTIDTAPKGRTRSSLINQYQHIPGSLARRLAHETVTPDDVPRIIAQYIDDVPSFELPKVRAQLETTKKQITEASKVGSEPPGTPITMRSQGDIGRIGTDDGTWAYRIDKVDVADSYRTRGVDPEYSPTKKAYFSDDPFKTYDLSDRVTAQGVGGVDFNIYRVKRNRLTMEQPGEFVTAERVLPNEVQVYTDKGWRTIAANDRITDPGVLDGLQATRLQLEQRIFDLETHTPVFRFPKRSAMRGFMRGLNTNTRFGRIMHNIFGETGKADFSKLTDDFAPGDRDVSLNRIKYQPDEVIEAVRKQMNAAKIPREIQAAVVEDMLNVRTPQGAFRWLEDVETVLRNASTKGGKRWLTPEMEETFRFAKRSEEERISSPVTREVVDANGTRMFQARNSLIDDAGEPMLTKPSDYAGKLMLPDMLALREAVSSIRWLDRWAKTQPWLVKAGWEGLRVPTVAIKTVATGLRLIFRPAVLVGGIPRLWSKIQFDQTLRRIAEGFWNKGRFIKKNQTYTVGGVPVTPRNADRILAEFGLDQTAIGGIMGEDFAHIEIAPVKTQTTRIDPHPGNPQAVRIVDSTVNHLHALADDALTKKLAAVGPDDLLTYLEQHPDSHLARWYFNDHLPYLLEHGKTPQQWVQALEEEMTQATFGDPALRSAIARGEWDLKGAGIHETSAGIEARAWKEEMAEANRALSETESGVFRQELLRRIDELDRRIEATTTQQRTTGSVPFRDVDAMRTEIMARWQDGRIEMPGEVIVNRALPRDVHLRPSNLPDRVLRPLRGINEKMYKPLRVLNKFDYSRKSTFTAAFRQIRESLIKRGYATKLAEEVAAQRAAFITKDLHYDIAARSSFDHAMKDMFWFSAVYREQLTTWGYKIPSKNYWPLGAPLRLFEAYTILDGLEQFGLLRWDTIEYRDDEGNLQTDRRMVLHVPWISDAIGKVLNNTEAGDMDISGLHPLTPGTAGVFPTLSPAFEIVLSMGANRAPQELRPFFELASRLFTFDQTLEQGPSFVPTPLRDALEMFGVHVPFDTLSPKAWGEAYRKGRLQATRWAMSDLAEEGILPPESTEIDTDEAVQAEIDALYTERGLDSVMEKMTETERGYLTGTLTELEAENLRDNLNPEEIELIRTTMAEADEIREAAEEAGRTAFDVDQQKYIDRVNERADEYRSSLSVVHLLGSVIFPGRFDAPSTTSEGEAFYEERQRQLDNGLSFEDGSIYEWQNGYLREHPEAFPYSVGVHPGRYGTPTYDSEKTLEPVKYIDKVLEQAHYWQEKVKKDPETGEITVDEDVPEGSRREIEEKFRARDYVFNATKPASALKTFDLENMNVPLFPATEELLQDLDRVQRVFDNQYSYDLSDDAKEALYDRRDRNMVALARKYGQDGEKVLRWYKSTPAEKLVTANYLQTPAATRSVSTAKNIWNMALAAGSSPTNVSEESGTLQAKVNLYRTVEQLRRENRAFDRELRRAELALLDEEYEGTPIEGRIHTYEYLFFGQETNEFGYQERIVEAL